MRRGLLLLALMTSFGLAALAQETEQTPAERTLSEEAPPEKTLSEETIAKLRFAGTQHEIIKTLLADERYDEVLPEFRKILELNLENENETLVVQSGWAIVEQLRKAERYNLAHQVVTASLEHLKTSDSRFYLLVLRGKIFQDQGRTQEALDVFRRAQELRQ